MEQKRLLSMPYLENYSAIEGTFNVKGLITSARIVLDKNLC
jgi:hypothetical protein